MARKPSTRKRREPAPVDELRHEVEMRRVPREDALEAGGARFCRGALAGRRGVWLASRRRGLAALARAGFPGHCGVRFQRGSI